MRQAQRNLRPTEEGERGSMNEKPSGRSAEQSIGLAMDLAERGASEDLVRATGGEEAVEKVRAVEKARTSGKELRRADLRNTSLSAADLSDSDLTRADVRRANLTDADLSGADLSRANLSESNLTEGDLSGANLSEANLSTAYLHQAMLVRADVRRANLRDADLSGANLSGANLSGAVGLTPDQIRRARIDPSTKLSDELATLSSQETE